MSGDFQLKEETQKVIGCAFEVLNGIGHGFHEKPYENALAVEFSKQNIPFEQQPRFPVIYKNVTVSEYIPDLIAFSQIIIDTKVIDQINNHEIGQMLNYLRITKLPVGLILNFKRSRLEFRRVTLDSPSPPNLQS
ncbi:MAG: GxxExxY protein [Verrucomicrobiaceae bacterium]